MREIEIKLRVPDLRAIEQKLKEKKCVLSEPIRQHDVIYSRKGSKKEFEESREGDVIIRIRYLDAAAVLTLKQQRSGEMDNLEYETEVKDPKTMDLILKTLGFFPVIEVRKVRRTGKLLDYEICLDEVEGLGAFVELEMLTENDANPTKVREGLFSVLESLGLSRKDEETRGYDTQMYFLRKR